MKFSIIVPVYNVEDYLDRCIKSLIGQTYKDIEIILVDDGSTDRSPEICDEYRVVDDRIIVIHKENGGLSDARNTGMQYSTGEYILFVDSDDYLVPDACLMFNNNINTYGDADILIGGLMDESGRRVSPKPSALVNSNYNGEHYFVEFNKDIIPCAVIPAYNRDFLKSNELRFVLGKLHEDNEFTPRAYIAASRIRFTGIVQYVRSIREDSITQKKDKRKNLLDVIEIGYRLIDYSKSISNKKTKEVLLDNICTSYLSLFYVADVFQYKNIEYSLFIDKKLVKLTANSKTNRLKAMLFILSPKAYICVRKTVQLLK